jgi:two-component system NarL family sensor kinase
MRQVRTGQIGLLAAVVAVVMAAWASWIAHGYTFGDAAETYLLTNSAVALTFGAFGVLVLWFRPGHRIGRLFVGVSACYTISIGCLGLLAAGNLPVPVERVVDIIGITAWAPAVMILVPLIVQLFPDGSPLSPRWRFLAAATVVAGAAGAVLSTSASTSLANEPIADNRPILPPAAGRIADTLLPLASAAVALLLLLSVVALALRCRRSSGAARAQVLWLLWAVAVFVLLNVQRIVAFDGPILFLLTLPLIPAAAAVAIVRHQLYDIRLIINRSLVYGVLTIALAGAYLAIVAGLSGLARDSLPTGSLIATAVVAVAFAPARSRLQTMVDRFMYGDRRNPAEAVARVGERLGADLEAVLQAVCDALRLPYAGIICEDRLLAAHGAEPGVVHTVALPTLDGTAAQLRVGLRYGERSPSPPDERALSLLGPPIAVALHAVRLAEQLRDSRARIVAAREEERRRLRRDLHDGLGTALTAVTLKADAAHNLQHRDPARAGELLLELRTDLSTAIADIRRLVYDLRPPALDELGLVGSLRQHAELNWRRDDAPFVVSVDAATDMPPLPAAVEVAAYRIATEAVTNALRHSDATSCRIVMQAGGALHLDIIDDGQPAPGPWQHGVGLRSMLERATELGGTLTAGPIDHGGRVQALLPLEAR